MLRFDQEHQTIENNVRSAHKGNTWLDINDNTTKEKA